MKNSIILLLIPIVYSIGLSSCSSATEPTESVNNESVIETKNEPIRLSANQLGAIPSLLNCTKQALYNIADIDITTYDSISSQYFQQVLDYEDTEAKVIENEINKLEYNLNSAAAQYYTDVQMDSIVNRLSQLKTDILSYDKILSGYVYVHTFANKGDTMSAIIITNRDGTDAEAIQIKTVNELNPDNYRSRIRP